ncbi:iron-sulfur cluster biosynthesis family protein [Holzapfeliella sp. He02]|uniref:Iron-sulfur cluster biosynthesis family protein n=1 Tax=Holzapfeliella saturejae TaxID=3082953 RepID=A0ABU8SF60_9LACO
MKLKIKESAAKYLQEKMPSSDSYVFLALDDGSNKFSDLGGTCAIGDKFQFVFSSQPDEDYNQEIENNAGLKVSTSKEENAFLGENLILDYKNASLVLSDDSGILDGAVSNKKFD